MELPLSVTRAGAAHVTLPGTTKNISSSGVLFTTTGQPDLGGPIEYLITLYLNGVSPLTLRCMGKVLRSERIAINGDDRRRYQIAATLERYEFVREPELRSSPSTA